MRFLCLLFLLSLMANELAAQESAHRDDFELWLSASISKKLHKKLTAQLSLADRFENNARFQKVAFVEPSLSYKLHKRIETGIAYRFSYDPLDLDREAKLISRSTFTHRIKPINISYRIRLDKELNSLKLLNTFRNRVSIRYKRKKHKLSPGISAELFTNNRKRGWIADKLRVRAGFHYRVNKRHRFTLAYIIQREFNQSSPNQDFILSTAYRYYWQTKKKDEKAI